MEPGKFEVYESHDHRWRWRLKTPSGEIVAVGDSYGDKDAALAACATVQDAAADATVVYV